MTPPAAITANPLPPIPREATTDRLIIKWRDSATAESPARGESGSRLRWLEAGAGAAKLSSLRTLSNGAVVTRMAKSMSLTDARALAQTLSEAADVEYVVPDIRLHSLATPNDSLYFQQWHYYEDAGGIGLPSAWDITTGDPANVVAVIDAGIVAHGDLAGRILPGYDFVSDIPTANDGDARDPDPSDPGDWITAEESNQPGGPFEGCPVADSRWHGTHVMGTIGATTDNGAGVAGIDWRTGLLPVRVLGKCGGFLSDLIDGMRWSAGLGVPGAPANANPARVLNLSLGATAPCPAILQETVDEIVALGKTPVVSAGNENTDVSNSTPANCNGVIAVAATTRGGGKADYSNFGSGVTISAPGGAGPADPDPPNGILSLSNTGATTPEADTFAFLRGTSMAGAHVSGVVSLMLAGDPTLSPADITIILRDTARPFTDSSCAASPCSGAIVNARAAVLCAASCPTANAGSDQQTDPNQNVTLNGSANDDDGRIVHVNWTQLTGVPVTLSGADTLTPRFQAPGPAGPLTLRLQVTDDRGAKAEDTIAVSVTNLPPTLNPIGGQAVNEGGTLSFSVSGSDPNGISPVLIANELPPGSSFDSAGGAFTWPNAGPAGVYQLRFTAVDAQDAAVSDSETVSVNVRAVSSSGGGGGGCGIGSRLPTPGMPFGFDPSLPGFVFFSLLYLSAPRRRSDRSRRDHARPRHR